MKKIKIDSSIKGFDPILLDEIKLNEWLINEDNFLVLFGDNWDKNIKHRLLLKKSYFLNPNSNIIYYECSIENKVLMVNKTAKNTLYRNIGFYFNKYMMVNDKTFIRELKKKKKIYILNKQTYSEEDIVSIDNRDKNDPVFINQEVLLMSQIGLFKSKEKNKEIKKLNETHFKKNFPYKKEVYFDHLISKALYNYSWQWYTSINSYLRTGDSYFDTLHFQAYMNVFGSTKEKAIQNIKLKIEDIDRCFLQAAPRNENDKQIFYRGMKNRFNFPMKGNKVVTNSEIIIPNYTSVSTDIKQALKFSDYYGHCCMYFITIDKGIPYIDMITNTKYKYEREILLPRNLTFKCYKEDRLQVTPSYYTTVYYIHGSIMNQNQFIIDTGCRKYPLVTIESVEIQPTKILKTKTKKTKKQKIETIKMVPSNVTKNLKPAVPAKKPRCPNGSRRDKKSGLCKDKNGNIVPEKINK